MLDKPLWLWYNLAARARPRRAEFSEYSALAQIVWKIDTIQHNSEFSRIVWILYTIQKTTKSAIFVFLYFQNSRNCVNCINNFDYKNFSFSLDFFVGMWCIIITESEVTKMKKILTIAYWILATIFLLWIVASYIDIIVDNCETITEHSEYNFFVLLTKKF